MENDKRLLKRIHRLDKDKTLTFQERFILQMIALFEEYHPTFEDAYEAIRKTKGDKNETVLHRMQ